MQTGLLDGLACEVCSKKFSNQQGLTYHRTHKVCQKFVCPSCNYRFRGANGLKYHTDNKVCIPEEKKTLKLTPVCGYKRVTLNWVDVNITVVEQSLKVGMGKLTEYIFKETRNLITNFIDLCLTNPSLDEYWCCYISNRRESYIKVFRQGKWNLEVRDSVFHELSNWAKQMIGEYLENHKEHISNYAGLKSRLLYNQEYLEDGRNPTKKELQRELIVLFANHYSCIKSKEKATGLKLKPDV
jgi:uncharacterized protein YbaR (Trm112 family)